MNIQIFNMHLYIFYSILTKNRIAVCMVYLDIFAVRTPFYSVVVAYPPNLNLFICNEDAINTHNDESVPQ